MNTLLIQFLRPWSIYTPGDTVAFEAAHAQALIDGGIAQRRLPPVETAPARPKDKPLKSPEKKKASLPQAAATPDPD